MEEVIFNGSTSKKPKGMAEVTMLLSGINSAHEHSSGDSAEALSDSVSVTRRLYRSGDSEYMLNKSQRRLKDIKDLFLDTGLEVKSYSILEHGQNLRSFECKTSGKAVFNRRSCRGNEVQRKKEGGYF